MEDLAKLIDPAQSSTEAEFAATWERYIGGPKRRALSLETRKAKVPRVGTVVQRSSANNQRKLEALMETPPPPPTRHGAGKQLPKVRKAQLTELFGDVSDLDDDEAAPPGMATDDPPAVIHGPSGLPPVAVKVDGHTVQVPYFAATVSRKYKAHISGQRYTLRFDRDGQCMYARKVTR